MSTIIQHGKIQVTLTSWSQRINLQTTFQNVRAAKIAWLNYQTVTTQNLNLTLLCSQLGGDGWDVSKKGSIQEFFLCIPLDLSEAVACSYTNYTNEMDTRYQHGKNISDLKFDVYINGQPELDISEANPVTFVLNLYE